MIDETNQNEGQADLMASAEAPPVPTEAAVTAVVNSADTPTSSETASTVSALASDRNYYNRIDIWLHVFKDSLAHGIEAAEQKAGAAVAAFEKLFGK